MRFEYGVLILGFVVFATLLLTSPNNSEKPQLKPWEMIIETGVPVGVYMRLQQLCGAIKANPSVLELDPAFVQFQYSMCKVENK